MAEDVCETWEELEQSGVLDKKLQQLSLRADHNDPSVASIDDSGQSAATAAGSASSSAVSISAVTILRRPDSGSGGRKKPDDESGTRLNVNSQPFVPRSQGPMIQMEDSTRTQFQPKLMILKRETTGSGNAKGGGESGQRANVTTRTFEEREAQYLKARERIMGSATGSPVETSPAAAAPVPRNAASTFRTPGQPEVPLLRQPQGPAVDGDRGFVRNKR